MKRKINKVLVANRGEIAIRIFRSLKRMGIRSVAIFSTDDANDLHVSSADESNLIHGSSLLDNYLNHQQIIKLALKAGVDAIHPGYGFLSESHVFSKAVRQAGLIFIGPGDEAIKLMGNKADARKRVQQLGLPVIEGASGKLEELEIKAEKMGFPVLVKSAAGGGGKGMRIASKPSELREMLEATQREAFNYFGNGEVYIEKHLPEPHHIEVQVLADEYGKVLTLFERECSVQRRYQKIVEEAPSPNVSPELRDKLMHDAGLIARDIGYVNAGTVEFLVSGGKHYFLEMNTRIQVEHPVTEMITGIDIVSKQIKIARGEPLLLSQKELKINGHAIEARIYAEDPQKDFQPSPGKVVFYRRPEDPGLRIDGSLFSGAEVSSQFDPMVSKIISHAASRNEALNKLIHGLEKYLIHGIQTNIPFLHALLSSDTFRSGDFDTHFCSSFMEDYFPDELKKIPDPDLFMAAFVFAGRLRHGRGKTIWDLLGHWRLCMQTGVIINGVQWKRRIHSIRPDQIYMEPSEEKKVYKMLRKKSYEMHIDVSGTVKKLFFTVMDDGSVLLQQNGKIYQVQHAIQLNRESLRRLNSNPLLEGDHEVHAPMFGKVIQVNVKPGDVVNKGDTLVILESMKMENRVLAVGKGRVQKVEAHAGQLVEDNQLLIVLSNVQ